MDDLEKFILDRMGFLYDHSVPIKTEDGTVDKFGGWTKEVTADIHEAIKQHDRELRSQIIDECLEIVAVRAKDGGFFRDDLKDVMAAHNTAIREDIEALKENTNG